MSGRWMSKGNEQRFPYSTSQGGEVPSWWSRSSSTYQCGHIQLHPFHLSWPGNHLEILMHCDATPLKEGRCKGTSIQLLTPHFSHPCSYVSLTVSVHIWPHLYHIEGHQSLNTPCQYIDCQLSGQVCHQWHWCFTSTFTHIRIGPHVPMAPSGGQQMEGLVLGGLIL
jgi:hypothetical protein